MRNSSRIIVNTIAQYSRSIVNMIMNLIATRVILATLGFSDYGIYSLISGVVAFLSFINNALAVTTQRYLSIAQGQPNSDESVVVFKNSLLLHLIVAIVLVAGLELIFPFLFDGFLNIPLERLTASKALYHIIAFVLCISVVSSPYKAAIIAHENIVFISVVEVLDAAIKLACAYALSIVSIDKLVAYGLFLLFIQIFNIAALAIYAAIKYPECAWSIHFDINKGYIKEFFSFAGWTFYSIGSVYGRSQGLAVVINKFMGTIVNASYGLALQISGALNTLSQSLLNAVNPQLMKSEGQGNRSKMLRFAEIESKISLLVFSAVSIPILFEIPRLLELWLKDIPEYSVFFCRMVILASIFDMITVGMGSANQAVGKIKNYTLIIYTIKLLTVPISFICLKLGGDVVIIGAAYVLLELISALARIPVLKRSANMNVWSFIRNVIFKSIIPLGALVVACFVITNNTESSFRFLLTFTIPVAIFFVCIYLWGLCDDEKAIVDDIVNKIKCYGK